MAWGFALLLLTAMSVVVFYLMGAAPDRGGSRAADGATEEQATRRRGA